MADVDGLTNRGALRFLEMVLRNSWSSVGGEPTAFYVALITDAAFDDTWNDMGDVTEVANGNGYTTGGILVERSNVGFDTLTEDDGNHWVIALIKNLAWTATAGAISTIKGAVLTDDEEVIADREILAYWNVVDADVNAGAIYQLEDLTIKLKTVA